jgi:GNAT superfamily N-acetyltransferase
MMAAAREAFPALERVEFDASVDLWRAAPAAVRAVHAPELRQVGTATCMSSRGVEPAAIFRRAVGLGVERAASEAELDSVLAHMNGLGQRYALPVAPHYRPAGLAAWVEKRGFTRGYAWMKFSRHCGASLEAPTDLEVRVVGAEHGSAFGEVVAAGFGLASTIAPWVGALPGRPNWACVMVFAESTPIAAGAAYVSGETAWLGFGATLPSHRRHGAQNALLARRLAEAAARGARTAVTETGERLPDKPSASYRNILRAGFEERYLRQNWMSPAAKA